MAQTLPSRQQAAQARVLQGLVADQGVFDAQARPLSELLPELVMDGPVLVAAPASVHIPSVRGHRVFRTRTLQVARITGAGCQLFEQLGRSLVVLLVDAPRPLTLAQRHSVRRGLPDAVILVAGLAP